LLLHLALADFANDEGTCFPSQKTLANKARTTEAWVNVSIKQMVKDGYLEIVEKGSGRGNRTTYRLCKGLNEKTLSEKTLSESQENLNVDASLSIYKNRQEPSLILTDQFEQFWKKYPRKVAKVTAKNVFISIMKKDDRPTLDVLLASVDKYASLGLEIKYVAHPATWLRQRRWEDEVTETSPTPTQKDWELDRAYDKIVPLAHIGRSWEECFDALRDLDERVVAPCEIMYWKIRELYSRKD
jgi:hypothetical protein